MKLKRTQEPETVAPAPAAGRAAIADRFKLDDVGAAPQDPNSVGSVAAAVALSCCLITIALMGIVTWLMYQNWELIRDV